jgi:hypothetical protein
MLANPVAVRSLDTSTATIFMLLPFPEPSDLTKVDNSAIDNLSEKDLVTGGTYFMVTFFDDRLQIPEVDTVIYLGQNYFEDGDQSHYFESYQQHVEVENGAHGKDHERVLICADKRLKNFFSAGGVAAIFYRLHRAG